MHIYILIYKLFTKTTSKNSLTRNIIIVQEKNKTQFIDYLKLCRIIWWVFHQLVINIFIKNDRHLKIIIILNILEPTCTEYIKTYHFFLSLLLVYIKKILILLTEM